jgi:hypothetical protein
VNTDPTKNLASSSDRRASISGLGASVVESSAAHAMLRSPAVADAAAIIVLNPKKPRREIPMMAPPDGQLLAEPTAERMRLADANVNRNLVSPKFGYST